MPIVVHVSPLVNSVVRKAKNIPSEIYSVDCIWFNGVMIGVYFIFLDPHLERSSCNAPTCLPKVGLSANPTVAKNATVQLSGNSEELSVGATIREFRVVQVNKAL